MLLEVPDEVRDIPVALRFCFTPHQPYCQVEYVNYPHARVNPYAILILRACFSFFVEFYQTWTFRQQILPTRNSLACQNSVLAYFM